MSPFFAPPEEREQDLVPGGARRRREVLAQTVVPGSSVDRDLQVLEVRSAAPDEPLPWCIIALVCGKYRRPVHDERVDAASHASTLEREGCVWEPRRVSRLIMVVHSIRLRLPGAPPSCRARLDADEAAAEQLVEEVRLGSRTDRDPRRVSRTVAPS
jgi:hypothetical protein